MVLVVLVVLVSVSEYIFKYVLKERSCHVSAASSVVRYASFHWKMNCSGLALAALIVHLLPMVESSYGRGGGGI